MKRAVWSVLLTFVFGSVLLAQEHAVQPGREPVSERVEHQVDQEGEGEGSLELWKWANFLILAGLLGWGIARSAPPFFRSRTEEIQRGIAEAARLKEEAEARAAKMEMKMASLQSELAQLRSDAKAELTKEVERVRQETDQLMARLHSHGEQEIAAITAHAQKELKAHAAGLAIWLAEQRIRDRMAADSQNVLFDRFLNQLDRRATEARP